jgi:hypothetical protein
MSVALFLLLSCLLLAGAASAGPTLATEDTLHTEVPEVLVRAPRVSLDEILERVARGEARRESLLTDQTFTAAVRLVREAKGGDRKLVEETVWRVYRKRPNRLRTVLLARRPLERRGKSGMDVDFSPGMGEQIVNFAFRASARKDFRYRLVGRDLVGDHLIYRVAFEPRSALQAFQPSGLVWIDTNEFVIAREEVSFPRSPVPLVLRRIDRMVVERQKVEGHWVLKRVLVRGEMAIPITPLGRSFDFGIQYDAYALNSGLEDSWFEKASR